MPNPIRIFTQDRFYQRASATPMHVGGLQLCILAAFLTDTGEAIPVIPGSSQIDGIANLRAKEMMEFLQLSR